MTSIETVTINCSRYDHPDFQLMVDSAIPHVDVDCLVSFLEESVQGGTRYLDGQTMQFGSMLFRIVALDNLLTLQEPDLRTFPISWTTGITRSLQLLRLQKDIAESVGLADKLDFPSIRCSLLVGADLTNGFDLLVFDRAESDGLDSGWFVGRLDTGIDYNDPGNLRCVSIYQAILNWPQIAGFLALPAGCRVEMSRLSTVISYNGRPLEIQKGSFIDTARSKQ
jgi:hypothetical protein